MKKSLILGVVFAAGLFGTAHAYDTFIPMGFGYSITNTDPSQLSAADRKIISKADVYETDIYQRQLRAKQFDARVNRFMNDRNSDGTDNSPQY